MELLNEHEAKLKAYDCLIDLCQKSLDEEIEKYNHSMICEAMQLIIDSINANSGYSSEITPGEHEPLYALDIRIKNARKDLKSSIEAKEKYLSSIK